MAKQFQISTYVGNYECNIFGKKTNGKFIQILNLYLDSDESFITLHGYLDFMFVLKLNYL